MAVIARLGLLFTAVLAAPEATSAPAKTPPIYILDGYRIEGLGPKVTAGLVAALKHHPGARIREADIKDDVDILAKELHARHIEGRLFTGMAEKDNGHLIVFFQIVPSGPPGAQLWTSHHLIAQQFQGAPGIPASALARASGLKIGDSLSAEKIVAARKAILTLVAKANPGHRLTLKVRVQTKPHGQAALTWIFGEAQQKHGKYGK